MKPNTMQLCAVATLLACPPAMAQADETETPASIEAIEAELAEERQRAARNIAQLEADLEAARILAARAALDAERTAVQRANEAREQLRDRNITVPPPPAQTAAGNTAGDGLTPSGLTRNFGGIDFGVGIAYTIDALGQDRISEAELVGDNDIVRVTRRDNARARLVLESHYFFTPCGRFLWADNPCTWQENTDARPTSGTPGAPNAEYPPHRVLSGEPQWGFGPFIAVQPAEDQLIDAVGIGLMAGFRRSANSTSGDSFNLGLGILVDINARRLGRGIQEGMPLPDGESEIRYVEDEKMGILVMSSYSF